MHKRIIVIVIHNLCKRRGNLDDHFRKIYRLEVRDWRWGALEKQ